MCFFKKFCCIFLSVILLGRMYDNCELSYKGSKIIMNKACDWSEWLDWDCSCCKTSSAQPFAVRKRAICCQEKGNLSACILDCKYAENSDTMYGNCSADICGGVSRDSTCGDSKLPAGIFLLTLPTKETPTTKSSSTIPGSNTPTSSTSPATTSVRATISQPTTTFVTSLTKNPSFTTLISPDTNPSSGIELTNSTASTATSSPTSIAYNTSLAVSSTISRDSSHSDSLPRLSTLSNHSFTTKANNNISSIAKNDSAAYTTQNEHTSTTQNKQISTTQNKQISTTQNKQISTTINKQTTTTQNKQTTTTQNKQISTTINKQTSTDISTNETSVLTYKSGLKEAKSHLGVILGSVFGSLLALGTIGGILYFLKRRKNRAKREASVHPDIEHHSTECSPEMDY